MCFLSSYLSVEELSLIFLYVVKANSKVHAICSFTSSNPHDFHANMYEIDGLINIVFIKAMSHFK
jgi:hypothetical protein